MDNLNTHLDGSAQGFLLTYPCSSCTGAFWSES